VYSVRALGAETIACANLSQLHILQSNLPRQRRIGSPRNSWRTGEGDEDGRPHMGQGRKKMGPSGGNSLVVYSSLRDRQRPLKSQR